MTNAQLFNNQKNTIKEAFKSALTSVGMESALLDELRGDARGLVESIIDNGDVKKALRKAELKFNDLVDLYTISNGSNEIEEEAPFAYVQFVGYGVSVEDVTGTQVVCDFIKMTDGEIVGWEGPIEGDEINEKSKAIVIAQVPRYTNLISYLRLAGFDLNLLIGDVDIELYKFVEQDSDEDQDESMVTRTALEIVIA